MLAGVAGLAVSGWLITRDRFVDDELHLAAPAHRDAEDLIEVAGAEPPVTVHLTESGDVSPRA